MIAKTMKTQEACEIFSAAVCNLDCKYCYLPKTKAMHLLHRQVLERVRKSLYIEDLKKAFGKNLEYLSLWGTEPTLGLRDFRPSLPQLLNTFPKLRVFSFSSNLMTNPKEILGFVEDLARFERNLKFELQVSLDGPSWITDTNRVGGASETIVKHFLELTEGLNKIDLGCVEVEMHLKPTFTIWVVKKMNEDEKKIHEYYRFFKDLENDFKRVNQSARVRFKNTCAPTMAVPGSYTSEDGKQLGLFFKKLRELGYPNNYFFRFKRILDHHEELFTKPCMFTCSGGDSNSGLGVKGDFHICHRTFFLNDERYLKSVMEKRDVLENWDISLMEQDKLDFICSRYVVDVKDAHQMARWNYVMRSYHDFTQLRCGYVVAMLKELAMCSQVHPRYLRDNKLRYLFAIFINSAHSCPAENLLNTSCLHFVPVSMIRLFANGAFQEILKGFANDNIPTRK